MATLTRPSAPVNPTRPRDHRGRFAPAPRPLPGRCRLVLFIGPDRYDVRPLPVAPGFGALRAWRLRKADGTRYDVAELLHGCECDCPDFLWRRDGIDPAGCKHIRALRALGLLR